MVGSDASPPDREPAPIVPIDSSSFMAETATGWTLVDFWAPWCGPCHQFAPAFEDLAREYDGRVRFGKLDVDQAPDVAGLLQIRGVPTLILFDPSGNEAARLVGVPGRSDLVNLLDNLGGLPQV